MNAHFTRFFFVCCCFVFVDGKLDGKAVTMLV